MKLKTNAIFTMPALMLALTGCLDLESDPDAASGLSVKTASGGTVTLAGPYKTACGAEDWSNDGTDDGVVNSISLTDSTWTFTSSIYPDDTSCSNIPDIETTVGSVTPTGDQTVASWEDGTGSVTAPTGLANATYSTFMVTVTSSNADSVSVGFQTGFGYVVDDSSSSGLTVYKVGIVDNVASTAGSYNNITTTDDTTGDTTGDGTTTFSATAASGTTAALAGPYKSACYTENNTDGKTNNVTLTGSTWTNVESTYTGDANCANTATSSTTIVADITSGADQTIIGWVDGTGSVVDAPTDLASAPYTTFTVDVTSSDHSVITMGTQATMAYVIDDSSSDGLTLYRLKDVSTGAATIAEPLRDFIVPVETASAADLQITIDSVVNSSGFNADVTYTVTNVGGTDAGSFKVMVWGQRDLVPDSYTVPQGGTFDSHAALAAGDSVTMTAVASGTWFAGDAFDAYVIADFFEDVTEQDEGLTLGTSDNLAHLNWTAQ